MVREQHDNSHKPALAISHEFPCCLLLFQSYFHFRFPAAVAVAAFPAAALAIQIRCPPLNSLTAHRCTGTRQQEVGVWRGCRQSPLIDTPSRQGEQHKQLNRRNKHTSVGGERGEGRQKDVRCRLEKEGEPEGGEGKGTHL